MITLSRPEGTSLTLKMNYTSAAAVSIRMVEWLNKKSIMRFYTHNQKLVIHPLYEGRVKFDKNTFSLELMNLQKNDSGFYKGEIVEKEEIICAAMYNVSVTGMYVKQLIWEM